MFAFDSASLPQLTTRKALIGVDFQNDFTLPSGALPILDADALLTRTAHLARSFRGAGDVVWVQSRFDAVRPLDAEQILATDVAPTPRPTSSRGRRPPPLPVEKPDDGPPDQEAFLSQSEPVCVKPDSEGALMAQAIKDATEKSDAVLTKTHYSAFNSTQLLRLLRAKMVMEVFICGSLANVGVYATALDAAGHGMSITIVEDCCGFRSDARQAMAIRNLIELTGCEIASSKEVLESLQPKIKKPPPPPQAAPPPKKRVEASRRQQQQPAHNPSTSAAAAAEAALRGKSETPEIVKNIRGLRLVSNEPIPVATTAALPIEAQPQPQERAPVTSVNAPAERHESLDVPPLIPSSKGKESNRPVGSPTSNVENQGHDGGILVKTGEGPESKKEDERDITKQSDTIKSDNNIIEPSTPTETTTIKPIPETAEDLSIMKNTKTSTTPEPEEGPLLQKGLCEGDTDVIEDILPASLENGIFDKLRDEIQWQRMSHQGGEVPRLVAVQGFVAADGSMPVYRHPSDESPPLLAFTPTVLQIKAETEKHLGHTLNHVLIQFYRDGNDYISEHSDKTLDIAPGSFIANVSLGAERTMVLRTKRLDKDPSRPSPAAPPAADTPTKRQIQRARLPHNSLCRMGLKTNMKWLHAIRQDRRADRDKSAAELAYRGGRISLTFRQIGTFLDKEETVIWGQGATGKTREEARAVVNGQTDEAVRMLRAFGTENHASEFDWAGHYGKGFDVLHMSSAARLFASPDAIVNNRIALVLAECGVNYAKGRMGATPDSSFSDALPVKFIDNDAAKSTVQGDMAIMLYLNARHALDKDADLAKQFTRFQQGLHLLEKYRALDKEESAKPILEIWDAYAAESEDGFLAGAKPTLPDFAVWPVLHAMVEERGGQDVVFQGLESLKAYYGRVLERESVKKVLQKGV